MKQVFCLDEDEIDFIVSKISDILYRLKKCKTNDKDILLYDICHAFDSAYQIYQKLVGEDYDNN